MPKGGLLVQTLVGDTFIPVENAKVTISNSTFKGSISTDSSGLTSSVELETPPLSYSMAPSKNIPYSLFDIKVQAQGYKDFSVKGCQVYPDQLAIQECKLQKSVTRSESKRDSRQVGEDTVDVPPNVLVGNYPRKVPETAIKVQKPDSSGFVVLQEAVIPQFIVVHAGGPNNASAPNYTVKYTDYIKNVASSEIFATWPENTIRANIYCINSFTLNRVYTEWYRNEGKDFTVTNSTAFDQAFTYGRNIYANISRIVDELFTTYVKIPNVKQPILTQYCDGTNVRCPGWLTQWGSKYLGDQGYTPYNILTHFYGSNIYLAKAPKVAGIPSSYPGYSLTIGSSGTPVRTIQGYLNSISKNYPLIPKVIVDGVFGANTKKAVSVFQSIFQLYPTGVVNYPTWYKISDVYVAVNKLAEPL
jgi:peptidoglycan hydrolase-like protein with peptidoglycan-binding domain